MAARIYTRSGDEGETCLCSGERVAKHDLRVEACGTVDELQAFLGVVRAFTGKPCIAQDALALEGKLAGVMAELSTVGGSARVTDEDVDVIERRIDFYVEALPEAFAWQVPGESKASAFLHVARTVARRAERLACRLHAEAGLGVSLMRYLNRVSDLCHVMARYEDEVV